MTESAVRLHQREIIQSATDACGPIIPVKHNIAIDKDYFPAIDGQSDKRDIEKSFLLPQDIAAAELHENIGIGGLKLEFGAEGHLDGHQGNRQMAAKYLVIRQAATVARWVEVTGDGPEVL